MNSIARQIPTIMGEALEIESPAERELYLQRVCGEDGELRHRIDDLLRDHAEAGDFLEQPAFATTLITHELAEAPGTQIGPYKLREQLGEGGMGIVYVADQMEPVRRRVALKIVKPGMDTREVLARFEAERQALAVMNHPHIAKILDGGATQTGRPYFVMELVKGISITEYCDRHKLSVRQRLELFILVCQAVQHAHQKGVIHRDLKPSNVLVELHDITPVPKVIDFGIAKAINQQLSQHTIYTQFAQLVGTPLYMSPEQAQLSGLDVDTRSDVYSLGVMLYELLTGTTPFDTATLTRGGLEEMRRIIREVEPLRPSHKISTLHAELLSTVSDRRQADVRKLSLTMRRELDWIVMRAMEKDRNRRYESASALAADVQRYLDDEPVAACPPSSAYRLRKFARRNKTTLLTAITVSTALLVGTAVSIWQAFEATNARKLADERLVLADERLVLADERLENEKQARADAVKQRKQASANLQQALDAVDQMLLRVADDRLAAIPGAEPVRQELFQDALKFYEGFFQQAPDDPKLRTSTAKAWARVGSLHHFLGNPTKAQEARKEAIQIWEALHAESPDNVQTQLALAEVCKDFGNCEHWNRLRFASAETALNRAIVLYKDLQKRFPDNFDYSWKVTSIEVNLGDNYKCTDRLDLAERTLRHAVDVQRKLWSRQAVSGKTHPTMCASLCVLAVFLREIRNSEVELEPLSLEAVRCAEVIVASDPESLDAAYWLVHSSHQYAEYLNRHGRLVEAEKHYRRAVEAGKLLSRDNPRAFDQFSSLETSHVGLAALLARTGRHSEALSHYRAAGDLMRPAAVLPAGYRRWEGRRDAADQGLLSSLEQLARGGQLDEAKKFCEELSQNRGSGSVAILSKFLAMRAWERINESARAKQIFNEVIEQLERETADRRSQSERMAIVGALVTTVGELGVDISRDAAFASRISAAIDQPLEFASGDIGDYRERGALHAALGQFSPALRDFQSAVAAGDAGGQAGWYERYQRALCYLHDGNHAAYRAAASEILSRFMKSQDRNELYWTVWTCVLAPDSLDDYRLLVELAVRGHDMPSADLSMKPELGAALYRAGEFEQALQRLNERESAPANSKTLPVYSWYFLAMTHYKLGHHEEAQKWLAQATEFTDKILTESKVNRNLLSWNRRLTLELLRAEATALIREAPTESPPKTDDPEPARPN